MSLHILVANDAGAAPGGVRSYIEAIVPALLGRGHRVTFLQCDDQRSAGIAELPEVESLRICELGLENVLRRVAAANVDVCLSNNMAAHDVEHALLDALPVVKFLHGYFGVCISAQKTTRFPNAEPCSRVFGPACLAHYFPRRCGGTNLVQLGRDYRWAVEQHALFERYERVVVASHAMQDELTRNGIPAERVQVAPLFAPAIDHAPDLEHTRSGILFLGRMTPLKGGDLLIEATARASARLGRKLRLVMAGEGSARENWRALAERRAVHAEFPGWLEGEERDRALRSVELLVVPSVWPEPFGLVGVEAGAFGVPAIAFDVGGIGEWLHDDHNGILLPGPPSVDPLTEAIVRMFSDRQLLSRMGNAAREIARAYTLDRHVDLLEPILHRAASRAGVFVPA